MPDVTLDRPYSIAPDPSSPWLNMREACAYAHGRSPKFLSREIKRGRLRTSRVGDSGQYFFRREWIDAWLEAFAAPVEVDPRRRR